MRFTSPRRGLRPSVGVGVNQPVAALGHEGGCGHGDRPAHRVQVALPELEADRLDGSIEDCAHGFDLAAGAPTEPGADFGNLALGAIARPTLDSDEGIGLGLPSKHPGLESALAAQRSDREPGQHRLR